MTNTEPHIENVPEKLILSCLAAISCRLEKLEKGLSEQEYKIAVLDNHIQNLEHLREKDISRTEAQHVLIQDSSALVINLRTDVENLAELVKDLEKSFDTMKEYSSCGIDSFLGEK